MPLFLTTDKDAGPGQEMAAATYRLSSLFVYGKLLSRFLQFDGDLHGGLIDAHVFPISLETRRNHLNAHFAIGNTGRLGFTVVMGLKLQPLLPLLSMVVNEMENNFGILDRLAIRVSDDCQVH